MPNIKVISNSETQDFQKCERLWFYKYYLQLTPLGNISGPLAYGIYGHDWLYKYYRELSKGADLGTAMAEANTTFRKLQAEGLAENDFIMYLMSIVMKYVTKHPVVNMEIVKVEEKLKAFLYYDPITNDEVYIAMKMDLLTRATEGKYAGEYILIDHKFKNNFIKAETAQMNVQLPKYIHVLRENGFPVKTALFNQLRYRQMDDEKNERFLRLPITPTDEEIKETIKDHVKISMQILEHRRDPDNISNNVTRHRDERNCEHCPFFTICNLQLKGKNKQATDVVKAHFKIGGNEYIDGYRELENE